MSKELKIATVFSGIGAFEQALIRLSINFKIQFACDNGDILLKDINSDEELNKIRTLKSISAKLKYVDNLYSSSSSKTNFVKKSYIENYGSYLNNNHFFFDATMLDGLDFRNKVDILVGGSPCQSFSIAGSRGGFRDTRGTLFYEFARLVEEINPKVFIYENVYGVLTHDNKKTWETMKNVFNELGYYFQWKILDSRDYGIPQGRRRVFVVGFKDPENCERFKFPLVKDLRFTMQDFLLDNCAEGNFNIDKNGNILLTRVGQKVDNYLSDKLVNYVMSPGTKKFYHKDAKIDLPIARAILSTQGNTHRASVNNYITTNGKIRSLEPRESLRLMGFPDSFKICVSRAQSYKQSGNSIVVDVLMDIFKQIQKCMER